MFLGAMAFAQSGLIFVEDHVQCPMQLIFYAPMAPDRLGGVFGRDFGRRDVVARIEAAAILELGSALDFDDGGDARQAQFPGKAPLPAEPVDLARHSDGALFDAAVPFVHVGEALQARLGSIAEENLDFAAQGRLVGFDGQEIIGSRLGDRSGDGRVAGDGVDADEGALSARRRPPAAPAAREWR